MTESTPPAPPPSDDAPPRRRPAAPGDARPGRARAWTSGPREPFPAWAILAVLGVLGGLGWVGWTAWRAPAPAEPFPLRVVDDAGQPVAGVAVALGPPEASWADLRRTDADGRVVFDGTWLGAVVPADAPWAAGLSAWTDAPGGRGPWRAFRAHGVWYRTFPRTPVVRGATLRALRAAVVELEPRLGAPDGPRVLADARTDPLDVDRGVPGDDDGVVRLPLDAGVEEVVLTSVGRPPALRSDPVRLNAGEPGPAGRRVVVLRPQVGLRTVRLERADGSVRRVVRRDAGPDGAITLHSVAGVVAGSLACFEVDVVVDGALGVLAPDVGGGAALVVRVEGDGWAATEGDAPPPERLALRRTVVAVQVVGGRPGDRVEAVAVGPLPIEVRGELAGDRLVFEDLVPGAWKVSARVTRGGVVYLPFVAFHVASDGTPVGDVALAVE